MQYRVKIYQINSDRDKNRVIFAGSDYLMKNEPALNIDASIYDEVFSGELDTKEPEKLFAQFNLERHPLHRGHSMSVSDVIVTEDGAFFCDSVGFKRIRFDESKTQKQGNLLRSVYVEPGKAAYEAEIVHNLRGMQQAVCGGLIEQILVEKHCAYVGNDEAKIIGMKGNRRYGKGGVIAGPFFICGFNLGEYRSLTDKEVKRYLRRFKNPENISDEETQADLGFKVLPF
ncbi:YodL domain-containing protein [Ruminococcus sp.]|uniref:YodL domain-containing protein n=1 Tax=Ruminococcus sp. TaxID=41978 RepID=UPI002E7687C3|nr:YodL domain-containing protein [Ruminococcus sp.]MEE1264548.1 YodL domain-containing protein [Ruminococcus sp.]